MNNLNIKIDMTALYSKIALIIAILCFTTGVVTAIPQQSYKLYGTATLNEEVLRAFDDDVISLKVDGVELVSYTMGDIPTTDNYVLKVPMDSDPSVTTAAQKGDTAYIYINGIAINEGPQVIGAPGTTVQHEISAKSANNPPSVTVLYPCGGESIPIGTHVQVSAHATHDTVVTSVTFSYSNNSGSDWNSIGAGTIVSGTAKDGIWNGTWKTNSLVDGSNYLVRAVADDGTSTRDDQSDSTFSLTSTPPSSNGNGGGGSSGSVSSGEDYYNVVLSETERQSVFKNLHISYRFDLEDNIVTHINFTSVNSAGTVAAKVEVLNHTSTLVSTPPPHEVYKNLNICVGNYGWATEKNMADITVSFIVDKSWITDNNIDDTTISLYHYSDNNWNKLVTRKVAEDSNRLYFEAETSGFSPFAVSGMKTGESRGEGIITGPKATVEKIPAPTPTEEKGIPGFGLFAGLSVLLIAVQLLHKKK